ncbi:uncharacterized protein LOC134068578 [Sardina pilchardus]|uniref:uncharacterized protein LOC134068578 n=1 Tax=Sardina pilchardus TaxID=27697 RepID=UPI002E0F9A02
MMCYGVLLMLTLSEVSDGNYFICKITKSITCHGVQGEPLFLQVMPDATGYYLVLKEITQNGTRAIFRYKRNQFMFFKETSSWSEMQRWHFTAKNGTISINPATGDSGTYRVEILNDGEGENVVNITFQIDIQNAQSTVTSTNTLITVNDNAKMDTPVYMILTSACLGVILLCGTVGVLYAYGRGEHTHTNQLRLENVDASILKRRQAKQPEQESCQEEMANWEVNLPTASMESPIVEPEEIVYADVRYSRVTED